MAEPTLVTRTYLRMTSPDALRPARPLPNARIALVNPCPPERYRELYNAVGRGWNWRDRNRWSDDRLAAHHDQPGVSVYLFTNDGE
jgi:hypothetical protein